MFFVKLREQVFLRAAIVFCCLCFCFSVSAQYSLLLSRPSGNSYGLTELSQTTMLNNSSATQSMSYLIIDCNEDGRGKIFSLRTSNFDLHPGTNNLSYSSITNAQVVSSSPDYYSFIQTGKLPQGKYTVCFQLYNSVGNSLASECISTDVTSDGTLILLNPFDAEILNTFNPNLLWSFSGFLNPDERLTYSIKVCELKDGQTYIDAMQFNPPLVFEENLHQTMYTYPVSAPPLNENGKYVWQVQGEVNKIPKYLSEIWMFHYKKDKKQMPNIPKKSIPVQYPHLEKTLNSGAYVFSKVISFRYNNECSDTLLTYNLYNVGTKKTFPLSDKPVKLKHGVNHFSFPVPKKLVGRKGEQHVFVLEVSNARKEKWQMKFSINEKK